MFRVQQDGSRSSPILARSVLLLSRPSTNFPPQSRLLVHASCWGSGFIPAARQEARWKDTLYVTFQEQYNTSYVSVGRNLVPGSHLDEVSLRNRSLFWDMIKKGIIDIWWRAFILHHMAQSKQGAVVKNQQPDHQKLVGSHGYLHCSLSRKHQKEVAFFSQQQRSLLLSNSLDLPHKIAAARAPPTLQNFLQSSQCSPSLYFFSQSTILNSALTMQIH